MRKYLWLGVICLIATSPVRAGTISGHLSQLEMNHFVEILGLGAASRLMRSAEAYELWPGVKLGVEIALLPTRDINQMGDGTGSVPGLNPVPRFYLAKGLAAGFEVILNYFPSSLVNTASTTGIMLKWTFQRESEGWLSAAAYAGYTHISAYDESYLGNDEEIGAEISKDYVRVKPYLGLGLLAGQGTFARYLVLAPPTDGSFAVIHSFLGLEIEMPVNVAFQLDFMNLALQGSIAFTKHFE